MSIPSFNTNFSSSPSYQSQEQEPPALWDFDLDERMPWEKVTVEPLDTVNPAALSTNSRSSQEFVEVMRRWMNVDNNYTRQFYEDNKSSIDQAPPSMKGFINRVLEYSKLGNPLCSIPINLGKWCIRNYSITPHRNIPNSLIYRAWFDSLLLEMGNIELWENFVLYNQPRYAFLRLESDAEIQLPFSWIYHSVNGISSQEKLLFAHPFFDTGYLDRKSSGKMALLKPFFLIDSIHKESKDSEIRKAVEELICACFAWPYYFDFMTEKTFQEIGIELYNRINSANYSMKDKNIILANLKIPFNSPASTPVFALDGNLSPTAPIKTDAFLACNGSILELASYVDSCVPKEISFRQSYYPLELFSQKFFKAYIATLYPLNSTTNLQLREQFLKYLVAAAKILGLHIFRAALTNPIQVLAPKLSIGTPSYNGNPSYELVSLSEVIWRLNKVDLFLLVNELIQGRHIFAAPIEYNIPHVSWPPSFPPVPEAISQKDPILPIVPLEPNLTLFHINALLEHVFDKNRSLWIKILEQSEGCWYFEYQENLQQALTNPLFSYSLSQFNNKAVLEVINALLSFIRMKDKGSDPIVITNLDSSLSLELKGTNIQNPHIDPTTGQMDKISDSLLEKLCPIVFQIKMLELKALLHDPTPYSSSEMTRIPCLLIEEKGEHFQGDILNAVFYQGQLLGLSKDHGNAGGKYFKEGRLLEYSEEVEGQRRFICKAEQFRDLKNILSGSNARIPPFLLLESALYLERNESILRQSSEELSFKKGNKRPLELTNEDQKHGYKRMKTEVDFTNSSLLPSPLSLSIPSVFRTSHIPNVPQMSQNLPLVGGQFWRNLSLNHLEKLSCKWIAKQAKKNLFIESPHDYPVLNLLAQVAEKSDFSPLHPLLKPYQADEVKKQLSLMDKGLSRILSFEMGLGKTYVIAEVISQLILKGRKGVFIVVVPRSVTPQMAKELTGYLVQILSNLGNHPNVSNFLLAGVSIASNQEAIISALESEKGILVTHYEAFAKIPESSLTKGSIGALILDEAQIVHTYTSARSQRLLSLTTAAKNKDPFLPLLLSTGTPFENNFPELWTLFQIANPLDISFNKISIDRIQNRIKFLHRKIAKEISKEGGEISQDLLKCLVLTFTHLEAFRQKILVPLLARKEKKDTDVRECWGNAIPESYPVLIESKITDQAKAALETAHNEFMTGSADVFSYTHKIKRILLHPDFENASFTTENKVVKRIEKRLRKGTTDQNREWILSSPLLSNLFESGPFQEMVKNKSHGLVFTEYLKTASIVKLSAQSYFSKQNIRVRLYTGEQNIEERERNLKWFRTAGKCAKLLVIMKKAGSIGLNLPEASTLFIPDDDWNPSVDRQATARVLRVNSAGLKTIVTFKYDTFLHHHTQAVRDVKTSMEKFLHIHSSSTRDQFNAFIKVVAWQYYQTQLNNTRDLEQAIKKKGECEELLGVMAKEIDDETLEASLQSVTPSART